MADSPMKLVNDKFGGRAKLVEQLAAMVDKQHGDASAESVKARLMGLSNQKLLRLFKVEQTVRERFGDREKLVAHLVDRRKKAGLTVDDAYRAKLDACSKARLLDLTREAVPERQAKRTPAQRLAAKRGRKQRARALTKLKA